MTLPDEFRNEAPSKLSVQNVSKRFRTGAHKVQALDNVSLEVGEGEFVCLVGPSGCGKTTLLNIIGGLEQADAGEVLADGKPVTAPGRDRMMMFQESALFPWLDVRGNVLFGLKLKPGLRRKERRELAEFYLRLVGLERFRRAHIHELSGGMKQRVALARSLAPNPRVLLMDEPFAALDEMSRDHLNEELLRLRLEQKWTAVFVTHSVAEAVFLSTRIVVLKPNPGRVYATIPIDLPQPRTAASRTAPEFEALVAQVSHALRGARAQ